MLNLRKLFQLQRKTTNISILTDSKTNFHMDLRLLHGFYVWMNFSGFSDSDCLVER
jgi:hypothetical protein